MSQEHNDYVTIAWLALMTAAVADLLACVFFGAASLNWCVVIGLCFGAYAGFDLVYRPTARISCKCIQSNFIVIRQRHSVRTMLYVQFGGWAAILIGSAAGHLLGSYGLWIFGLIGAAAGSYCAYCIPELGRPTLFKVR